MGIRSIVTAALAGTLALSLVAPASAYVYSMDYFEVTKNGGAVIFDGFDDGTPPPSAPDFSNGSPGSYTSMAGTMGPEIGGKLILNSSDAELSFNAVGNPSLLQRALLATNTQPPSVSQNGLKNDDAFRVRGLFDLVVPNELRSGYGIRLDDRAGPAGPQDDNLRLDVRMDNNGNLLITYLRQDFVADAITVIDSIALETSHDQVLLQLERLSAGDDAITASFAYVDGGVVGAFTTFGATADIFHGEEFTRAGFSAFIGASDTPVPEPATAILLGSMLLLGAGLRRQTVQ